ncbi:23S rRNA pseudouridylate synthase [Catenovulum agarivorans DS-2]|uniref:23S rRNA pseudouridylate synthase n=1 Tax=Catenovulum agarivorans DS-2 TaxID=1328313 RepID=W7QKX7_9ALTE|nr:pseudouridine synthase [Catenovulum agarivorans]EWH09597.1 23S rRNA pseudouridylate synthase [Catenovulum agarivorans DS-2]
MINIVATNTDFYICEKPAGLDFHDDEGHAGFFSLLKTQTNENLYPAHRLDKQTSGLILVTRNLAAEHAFNQMFLTHTIEKYYWAIAGNKPKQKQGRIIGDMEKSRNRAWKLNKSKNNPAKTFFYSYGLGDGHRLYLLRPYSGKTHQLRVALKSIGVAILGDDIYKGPAATQLHLHASCLKFNYQGQNFNYYLPPKQTNFQNISAQFIEDNQLNQPWLLNWPKL